MDESWKPVPGFEDKYEVSDLGRVRSLPRSYMQKSRGGKTHVHTRKGQLLKPAVASHGYPMVVLGRSGGSKTVHSLVAAAFLGPALEGQEIRHKDGDRKNPRLSNLEYGTRTQNILDAVAHGTWASEKRRKHWATVWNKRRQNAETVGACRG